MKHKMSELFFEAGKFVASFFISFAFFSWLFSYFSFFNWATAYISSIYLSFLGISSNILIVQNFPTIVSKYFSASIIELCSGKLEIAFIAAALLSSFDRKINYRLWGVLVGVILVFLLNPLRIVISLLAFHSLDLSTYSLFHNILFRISLIFFLIIFYYLWYLNFLNFSKMREMAKSI